VRNLPFFGTMFLVVLFLGPWVFDKIVLPELKAQRWPEELIKQAKIGYVVACLLMYAGLLYMVFA
jgi:hypothetical protein